jgi:hypothetical protein
MQGTVRDCVVCGLEVNTLTGMVIRHTVEHKCSVRSGVGHYSHALCLDPDKDLVCAACNPLADGGSGGPLVQGRDPQASRDYIDVPMEHTRLLAIRKQFISAVVNFNRHREDISDPVALIRLGPEVCPVSWLLRQKKIGLHHILEAGGLVDDFLAANYRIGDLAQFEDLDPARTPSLDRRQRALEVLGLTAEHLRDHRGALPMDVMRRDYGIGPRYIADNLGLVFDAEADKVIGWTSNQWSDTDLVYLGVNALDLPRVPQVAAAVGPPPAAVGQGSGRIIVQAEMVPVTHSGPEATRGQPQATRGAGIPKTVRWAVNPESLDLDDRVKLRGRKNCGLREPF